VGVLLDDEPLAGNSKATAADGAVAASATPWNRLRRPRVPAPEHSPDESDKVAAERAYAMAGIGPSKSASVGQHCAFGPQGLSHAWR